MCADLVTQDLLGLFPLLYMYHHKRIASLWSHQSLGLTALLKGERFLCIKPSFHKSIQGTYFAKSPVLFPLLFISKGPDTVLQKSAVFATILHFQLTPIHEECLHLLCDMRSVIEILKVVV